MASRLAWFDSQLAYPHDIISRLLPLFAQQLEQVFPLGSVGNGVPRHISIVLAASFARNLANILRLSGFVNLLPIRKLRICYWNNLTADGQRSMKNLNSLMKFSTS